MWDNRPPVEGRQATVAAVSDHPPVASNPQMSTGPHPAIDLLSDLTPLWWQAAIVFFLVGDLVTTFVGFQLRQVVEAGPLAAWIVNTHGATLIIPLKLGVVAAFYGVYRVVPRPHNIGVPLGLAALGLVVTIWNGAVIVAALL